jgi:hypothetical protein
MSWTSKSEMMEEIYALRQELDHLLHEDGGDIAQINVKILALQKANTEILAWRDSMSKHITTAITAPLTGTTQYGSISVTATAVDTLAHAIAKVDFYIDDVFFATDAASPYTQTLDTTKYSNASHTIKVLAYCTNAAVGWGSATITITINNVIPTGGTTVGGGTASYGDVVTVRILAPTPGSSVPMSFYLTVVASCSAGHPITSLTCEGFTDSNPAILRNTFPVSFDSYTQQKKTFTVTATCAQGTTGTATATYINAGYTGPPPGGAV